MHPSLNRYEKALLVYLTGAAFQGALYLAGNGSIVIDDTQFPFLPAVPCLTFLANQFIWMHTL
jgi:hypothetical protein